VLAAGETWQAGLIKVFGSGEVNRRVQS
jgi:hypothetical protein